MKKITFLFALFVTLSWQGIAQYGCGSAVTLTNGFTQTNITTPGTGGAEDWNTNPTGTSINSSYWDDDVYLFEYTSGTTAEQISMTILTRNGWNGIGIFDDCTGTTFSNELDAAGANSGNTSQTVSAVISAGNTVYIAVGQWGTPNDLDFDVTSFTVTTISCPDPTVLTATNVTTTTADLGWTENGTATAWDIEWDTAGFTATGTPTITGTTTNPHSLTGLTAATSYEFYVRASCSATDSSAWVGPYNFTTLCAIYTAPYSQPFNSFLPSACWEQAGSGTPSTGPGGIGSSNWGQSGFPGSGSGGARVNLYSSSKEEWILSPQFDLSAGGPYEVRVQNMITEYSGTGPSAMGSDDSVQVLISTDGGSTWAAIHTWDAGNPAGNSAVWTTLDLTSYSSATTQFAIWGSEGAVNDPEDYYFYVGGFELRAIPSCTEPDTLMISSLTSTSVDLGWTEMGTATTWDIEWDTAGFTQGAGTMVTGTTTNPYSLTGLTSNTSYEFYVRADCGGATSPWSGPYSFNTLCSDVTVFPYTENFDGSLNNGVWNCWTVVNNDNDSYTWRQGNTYITPTHSPLYAAYGSGNGDDYLITPQLTIGATPIRVKFWDKVESAGYNNTYSVWVSTTGTNVSDFTDSITTIDCSNTAWLEHVVDLTAYTNQSVYVTFHQTYSTSSSWGFGIDDFTAELIPTCPAPDTLNVANVGSNNADLMWTELGSATNWQVEIDTTGFTLGTGSRNNTTATTFTATSLVANTNYDFYVRAVCGANDSSVWVGPYSFTTSPDTINSFPFSNDIEAGLGMFLGLRSNAEANAFVDTTAASTGVYGIHLTGNSANDFAGGSTSATETQAFVTNVSHVSGIDMLVDATNLTSLSLKFDMKQTYSYGPNYSWGRVTVNGTQLGASVNPSTAGSDPFITVNVDLSAFSGTVFTLSLEHSGKYNTANGSGGNGDNAYIDNIQLYQPVVASAVVDSNVTCFGGANGGATVSATLGATPYTYLWSNGATTASITGVMAGTYDVTVSDAAGDSSLASVTITEGAALSLDLGNDTSVCIGASLTLDAGTFTSYLWDDASTMQTRATVNTTVGVTSYSVTVSDANACTAVDTLEVTVMADPIVALGNDTSICDGSMLTLDAGSFATYAWDDASTMQTRMVSSVLGASTYSVTVTNVAGCSGSDDIIVTSYAPVMVDLGNDTSVCDAVSLTLDAGTFTSYVWDDASTMQTRMTVSTLGAVNYSVEVTDANGCTGNDTIEVTGFAIPMVNLGNDTTVCDGESITLDAGAFTSYLWDDASTMQTRMTVSTLGAVEYSVEVTDANGCMAADTVEVTGSAPVMVDLGGDTSLCNGAPYTLDAGAGFASYFWNNGFNTQTLDVSSTTAGTMTYSVRVEDAAGCSGRDTAIISVKAPVLVDLGADTNIWAEGVDTHTLDAGAGFTSYLWSDNVTTTQTYEVKRSTEGLVSVIVEDADGCEGTDTVKVTFAPVGVEEFTASTLTMYPNPAVDQVTVELSNLDNVSNVNVTFLSVTGQVVLAKNIVVKGANSVETFDVSSLATGTYLVQFEANGNVVTKQFVIK